MDAQKIIEQFTDYLLPSLTPYEAVLYIFLLRNTHFLNNVDVIRIGKRTISDRISKSRGTKTAYSHVTELLAALQEKQCIKIGDTNRDGTLYAVFLPEDIPLVHDKQVVVSLLETEDYYTNPDRRIEVFERDSYKCFYCGEKLTPKNASLDHLIPQHAGGLHAKDNLKTACLTCNSIKSGKSYEEAAPLLLKSIQERRGSKTED